jgi:hypothetical protein
MQENLCFNDPLDNMLFILLQRDLASLKFARILDKFCPRKLFDILVLMDITVYYLSIS